MTIREIKRFRSAQNGILNDKYLITTTGSTVTVYDVLSLEEISSFRGMSHAYTLTFRPGRNDLAVKSYDNDLFFYSLDNMQLIRKLHVYKSSVTQDSGCCYSHDGSAFYNIVNTKDLLTYLVRYDADTLNETAIWFANDKYFLYDMQYVPQTGQYMLQGYERLSGDSNNQEFLLWFDESSGTFSRIDQKYNAMKMLWMQYSPQQDALMSFDSLHCSVALHEMDGTLRRNLLLRSEKTKTSTLRELMGVTLTSALNVTDGEWDQNIVSQEEMLNKALFSEDGKYMIAAKTNGVWVFESVTMNCQYHIPIKYATDVIIKGNRLYAFTWNGGFAYEVDWQGA